MPEDTVGINGVAEVVSLDLENLSGKSVVFKLNKQVHILFVFCRLHIS